MDFVITYTEIATDYKVIWSAKNAQDAITSFWMSFDYDDRDNVSNVKIYSLVEIEGLDMSEAVCYK